MPDVNHEKRVAARAAAELVEDGMTVGLGTGSTVAHLLDALAERGLTRIRCVATSIATEQRARDLGLAVEDFDALERLDIAIDGTDQVDPAGWLIKGGGGAHTREKIVAAAADRFVVIADSTKVVDALTPPVPVELLAYGLKATLHALGDVIVRLNAPPSPDAGVIADVHARFGDAAAHAAWLSQTPGVVDHGLFAPALVSDVLIARGDDVEHRTVA
jgi:ribose 5-phosphate isomerase A